MSPSILYADYTEISLTFLSTEISVNYVLKTNKMSDRLRKK